MLVQNRENSPGSQTRPEPDTPTGVNTGAVAQQFTIVSAYSTKPVSDEVGVAQTVTEANSQKKEQHQTILETDDAVAVAEVSSAEFPASPTPGAEFDVAEVFAPAMDHTGSTGRESAQVGATTASPAELRDVDQPSAALEESMLITPLDAPAVAGESGDDVTVVHVVDSGASEVAPTLATASPDAPSIVLPVDGGEELPGQVPDSAEELAADLQPATLSAPAAHEPPVDSVQALPSNAPVQPMERPVADGDKPATEFEVWSIAPASPPQKPADSQVIEEQAAVTTAPVAPQVEADEAATSNPATADTRVPLAAQVEVADSVKTVEELEAEAAAEAAAILDLI